MLLRALKNSLQIHALRYHEILTFAGLKMVKRKQKHLCPPRTSDEALRFTSVIESAVDRFTGDLPVLESAIGMYALGRSFGWKVLYIIHSKATIRKYEAILDIRVRDEFPEVGIDAERSYGFRVVKQISNFWKAVSGEELVPDRRLAD